MRAGGEPPMKWLATASYYAFLALYYLLFAGSLLAFAAVVVFDLTSTGGPRGVLFRTAPGLVLLALLVASVLLSVVARRRSRGETRGWLLYGRFWLLSWALVLLYWAGRYVTRHGAFREGIESDDFWGLAALPVVLSFPWILRAGAGRQPTPRAGATGPKNRAEPGQARSEPPSRSS